MSAYKDIRIIILDYHHLIMNGSTSGLPHIVDELSVQSSVTMPTPLIETQPHLIRFLLTLYVVIFLVGLFGNSVVLYIVITQKSMQTITNRFIACLSVSDLLICLFAVPFTPINALGKSWIFGAVMCKLIPVVLVLSVFVSTLTSVVIAIDRYMVIVYPHAPRMSMSVQIVVLVGIWVLSGSAAVPVGIFTMQEKKKDEPQLLDCNEQWPNGHAGLVYTWVVFFLQLVIPAVVITLCYTAIGVRLYQRSKNRLGSSLRDENREKIEECRNKRINRMLIAMIVIFIICWLPLNIYHLAMNHIDEENLPSQNKGLIIFLFLHITAMSSVMYNPFLYGWMNENFNKHFRQMGKKVVKQCCRLRSKAQTKKQPQENGLSNKTIMDTNKNGSLRGSTCFTSATYMEGVSIIMEDEQEPFLTSSSLKIDEMAVPAKSADYLTVPTRHK